MTIELKAEEELDHLEDFQYAISLPLCILCNDASLLEQALEIYQGRVLYAGDLPEEELLPLANRYGLVIEGACRTSGPRRTCFYRLTRFCAGAKIYDYKNKTMTRTVRLSGESYREG